MYINTQYVKPVALNTRYNKKKRERNTAYLERYLAEITLRNRSSLWREIIENDFSTATIKEGIISIDNRDKNTCQDRCWGRKDERKIILKKELKPLVPFFVLMIALLFVGFTSVKYKI